MIIVLLSFFINSKTNEIEDILKRLPDTFDFKIDFSYGIGKWDAWSTTEFGNSFIWQIKSFYESIYYGFGGEWVVYKYRHPTKNVSGSFFSPSLVGQIKMKFYFLSLEIRGGTGWHTNWLTPQRDENHKTTGVDYYGDGRPVDYIRLGLDLKAPQFPLQLGCWVKKVTQFDKYLTIGGELAWIIRGKK